MKGSVMMVSALLLFLVFSPSLAHSQLIGSNVEIADGGSSQRQRVEPTIAIDPHSPNVIVAGAQDYRLKTLGEHRWNGFYRSTDGGLTWSSGLLPGYPGDTSQQGIASPLKRFNATSDPVLAFDRSGNVYYAGIAFNIGRTGWLADLTAFVAKYSNDGSSYSGATLVYANGADKPWITVDTTGGRFDGNVYLAFDFGCGDGEGMCFTRSTDRGVTFSDPVQLPTGLGLFPGIAVAGNGDVFVSALGFGSSLVTSLGFGTIIVTKSTDGGFSFQQPVRAANNVSPLLGTLQGNFFRAITIPQVAADGRGVYLVYDNFKDNDAEVLFVESTDGGNTWSRPFSVNDQKKGDQFFPSIAVSSGVINIIWYDGRLGQYPNGTITALNVFYSSSTDGGVTFSPNIRITTASFNPNLVLRTDGPNTYSPFMGDYIQLTAGPTGIRAIWSDNRNACDSVDPTFGCVGQDIFTATITF
jgi:hypothetical protein